MAKPDGLKALWPDEATRSWETVRSGLFPELALKQLKGLGNTG